MQNDEQANSTEQEVVDFIDAIPPNVPFESTAGSAFVDRLRSLDADAQIRLTVHFLRRFASQLDWRQFRKREREEGRIEDSERNPWEVESERRTPEYRAEMFDLHDIALPDSLEDTAEESKDLNRRLRETEEMFGLTLEDRGRAVAKLGQVTKSPLGLRDILPPGVFPLSLRSVSEASYDRNLHVAVKEMLEVLGPENRRSHVLVAECGSLLARQFPHDFSGDLSMEASFHETVARAERYFQDSPDNLFLLLWRGVLARWEGNDEKAFELAIDFWQMSDDLSVEDCRRILWMYRETTFLLSVEMEWMNPNCEYDLPDESIFEIRHDWLDREEPLVSAFVRRAVGNGTWDANCVAAYLAINTIPDIEFKWWYTDDVLPPSSWIWIAQSEDWYFWPNAPEWEVAFRLSSVDETPDESFLTSAVLLCGLLYDDEVYGGTVDLGAILGRLLGHHKAGQFSREIKAMAQNFLEFVACKPMPHLAASDGLMVARFAAKLGGETLLNAKPSMAPAELEQIAESSHRIRAETRIQATLGRKLWNELHPETQRAFISGEILYQTFFAMEGEQNLGPGLFHFSLGLLHEINLHFWGPVRDCKETKGELLALGLDGSYPKRIEWSAFIKIIEHHESLPNTLRVALGRRIDVKWFSEHVEEIDRHLYVTRRKGAHSKPIDREEASLTYSAIMKKGRLAQQFLEALGIHRRW